MTASAAAAPTKSFAPVAGLAGFSVVVVVSVLSSGTMMVMVLFTTLPFLITLPSAR